MVGVFRKLQDPDALCNMGFALCMEDLGDVERLPLPSLEHALSLEKQRVALAWDVAWASVDHRHVNILASWEGFPGRAAQLLHIRSPSAVWP